MIDWRGQEYGVGDTVLYPRMSGRSCEMQEGRVLEFRHYQEDTYKYEIEMVDGVSKHTTIVVPRDRFKVRVLPTKSSRDFYRTGVHPFDHREEVKPVWITIESNITKV